MKRSSSPTLLRIERILFIGLLLGWSALFLGLQLYPWVPPNSAGKKSLPGYLVFRLQPPNATLWIDGKQHTKQERGATLTTGKHSIRAEAKGYFPKVVSVHIQNDDATLLRLRLKPRKVSIRLTSRPSGASVFLNGKALGKTPIQTKVVPRWYEVRLQKTGYVSAKYNRNFLPKRTQQALHFRLSGASQKREKDGALMLWVQGRVYQRGSNKSAIQAAQRMCGAGMKRKCPSQWFSAERPRRYIKMKSFWIDQTEVTQQQYQGCVVAGICKASRHAGKPKVPVTGVTWEQAKTFCQWVNARLPTEAEWELAAQGPTPQAFPWGHSWSAKRANHGGFSPQRKSSQADASDGFKSLAPVGSFPQGISPYRLLDVAGNASEWVEDCYHTSYYRISPELNPVLRRKECQSHTIRGGSYLDPIWELRTTARKPFPPSYTSPAVGFRCAKDSKAIKHTPLQVTR